MRESWGGGFESCESYRKLIGVLQVVRENLYQNREFVDWQISSRRY